MIVRGFCGVTEHGAVPPARLLHSQLLYCVFRLPPPDPRQRPAVVCAVGAAVGAVVARGARVCAVPPEVVSVHDHVASDSDRYEPVHVHERSLPDLSQGSE